MTTRNTTSTAADQRRVEIASVAAELFNERGVDLVNMDDLAKAVGLAKPSLYHYYRSKEEILFAIHINLFTLMLGQLKEHVAASDDPRVQLRGVFGDIFESMDSHPGHTRVFREYARRLSEEHQQVVLDHQREYEGIVRGIIAAGIAQGHFRDVDLGLSSLAMFGMAYWSYQWYTAQGRMAPQELADLFFDYFVQGIVAR